MPELPETEYMLSYDAQSENELTQMIFQSQEPRHNPWPSAGMYTRKTEKIPSCLKGTLINIPVEKW